MNQSYIWVGEVKAALPELPQEVCMRIVAAIHNDDMQRLGELVRKHIESKQEERRRA